MNVPKLRFGEFATEERQRSTLGNLTKWSSGGTPSKENPNFWEGDIPWISASTMRGLYYSDSEVRITSEGLKNGSKLAEKGDLLLLVRGSMLFNKIPVGIAECDLAFNQDVKSLKPNPELNASYLLQWFQASEHKLLSMVVGTGIGAGKLETSDVQSIDFLLPSKKEQQKIADFLSAVDEKITALTAQKTALTHYKQGMMQRIFAQTLRFKDDNGADYPEWDRTSLSQLGTTYGGLTGKTKEDFGIGKPFITYKQVFDDSKIDISRFEHVQISKDETQNRVKRGDIIFTTSSETANEIAFSSVLLDEFDELYLNSFCFGYRPNSLETFLPEYARYLFRSEFLRKEIIMLAQGSTRYNISKNQLMKLHIPLPSMPEQTKIAQFLTELDDKINAVDAQIQSAQQWKQGLLQQMFV